MRTFAGRVPALAPALLLSLLLCAPRAAAQPTPPPAPAPTAAPAAAPTPAAEPAPPPAPTPAAAPAAAPTPAAAPAPAVAPATEPAAPSAAPTEPFAPPPGEPETSGPVRPDHAVRFGLGMAAFPHLGGLSQHDREAVYSLGATSTGGNAIHASGTVEYHRGLLALRFALAGRKLVVGADTHVNVFDGVEHQELLLKSGGGYVSVSLLAGVTWEPELDTGAGGTEGLSVALSALGGYEHVSLWGAFGPETEPNFRLCAHSFHWYVERERVDAEAALRWRHVVGGETIRHLLGLEAGLGVSLLVHIPYLSTASAPISGVTDSWGTWSVFLRVIYEIGLPGL